MQVVEDVEEGVLRLFLVLQVLDVVNDEGVYTLIEVEELVYAGAVAVFFAEGSGELSLELARGDI